MLANIFKFLVGGDHVVKSIESIAKEWIDTPEEKAKASTLWLKTLDPNGLMRRDISATVSRLFTLYICTTMILLLVQSFNIGDTNGVKLAIDSLKELFIPITSSFTAIITASFGVNAYNIRKEK